MVTCPWWEQVADLKAVADSSAACKTLWTAFIARDPFAAFPVCSNAVHGLANCSPVDGSERVQDLVCRPSVAGWLPRVKGRLTGKLRFRVLALYHSKCDQYSLGSWFTFEWEGARIIHF